MVGRLQGTVEGRPFLVQAGGDEIELSLGGIRILRAVLPLAKMLVVLIERMDLKKIPLLKLRIKGLPTFKVRQSAWAWKLLLRTSKR